MGPSDSTSSLQRDIELLREDAERRARELAELRAEYERVRTTAGALWPGDEPAEPGA